VAAPAADVRLTPEERQTEAEWLRSLGLNVPEGGGVLLEMPFAPPLSRRSFLMPTSLWRAPSPSEVTASSLRRDLVVLRTIMEKAYGGWDSAIKLGWDWNRWFTEWDRELAAKGDSKLPLAEALAPFERLERVQLDNHSGPLSRGVSFGSGSRTAVLQTAPSGPCNAMRTSSGELLPLNERDPAQLPRRGKILRGVDGQPVEGFYLSYPERRGKATEVNCGNQWIPLSNWGDSSRRNDIAALAGQAWNRPSYRMLDEKIGYLRLPTFSKQNDELLRQLVSALPEGAGHEKLLVVDMRQNDGGDSMVEAMGRWIDVAALRPAIRFNRRQPKSCVYDALRWGYTQNTSQSLKPPLSDALRRSLQQQLDGLFEPVAEGCPVHIEEQHSDWDYRRHDSSAKPAAGRPRIMVLADSGCGSDCEYMAYVLAAVPGSVIVGENTYGIGQFIQPGYFILPHTLLKFRIALGMSDTYGDGRSFDGYGLAPDIVLASDDANKPEAILKLARALAE
jgi:Peptidase family S41